MSSYRSDAPEYKEPVALDPKGLEAAVDALMKYDEGTSGLVSIRALSKIIRAYLAASPSVREIGEPFQRGRGLM